MKRQAAGLIVLHVVHERIRSTDAQVIEAVAYRAQDIDQIHPVREDVAQRMGMEGAKARVTFVSDKRGEWVTETLEEVVSAVNARIDHA